MVDADQLDSFLLTMAMTALGLNTVVSKFKGMGWSAHPGPRPRHLAGGRWLRPDDPPDGPLTLTQRATHGRHRPARPSPARRLQRADLDAFIAYYHPDVVVMDGDEVSFSGREAMRSGRDLFEDWTFGAAVPERRSWGPASTMSATGASIPRPPSAPRRSWCGTMADGLIARVQFFRGRGRSWRDERRRPPHAHRSA